MILECFWDLFMSVFGTRFFLYFCFKFVSMTFFLSISNAKFQRLGLPNQGFRMEGIVKIVFSWKSFLLKFGIDFYRFLEALGTACKVF